MCKRAALQEHNHTNKAEDVAARFLDQKTIQMKQFCLWSFFFFGLFSHFLTTPPIFFSDESDC